MQKRDLIGWAESRRELWLDCVRIYLGLGLFARGLLLITNSSTDSASTRYFEELVHRSGFSWLQMGLLLHYVTLAHFVGGAMLAAGFLTRIAALVQVPVLFGAVFLIHRGEGLFVAGQSLEFSALVLFLLVVVLVSGPGALSLDRVVFGSRAASRTHDRTEVSAFSEH
jgi:putative oxidoreductase